MIIAVGNKTFDIEITDVHQDSKFIAKIDGETLDVIPELDRFGQISAIIVQGKRYEVRLVKEKGDYKVSIFSTPLDVSIAQPKSATTSFGQTETDKITHQTHLITSPMSGLVIIMPVQVGQKIAKDSQLLVLEAMKMQNEIKSPIAAIVREIYVKVGQTVEKDDKLLSLEPI